MSWFRREPIESITRPIYLVPCRICDMQWLTYGQAERCADENRLDAIYEWVKEQRAATTRPSTSGSGSLALTGGELAGSQIGEQERGMP